MESRKVTITEKDNHTFISGNANSGRTNELVNIACANSQYNKVLFISIEVNGFEIMDRIVFENDNPNKVVHNIVISSISTLKDLEEMLLLNGYKVVCIDALYLLPYNNPRNIFKDTMKLLDKYDVKGYFTFQTSSTTF